MPLQLQLVEPEFCPASTNQVLPSGRNIRAGIEFNAIGKRTAYWMYRSHPGERFLGTHEMPENGSAFTVCGHEAMTLSARDRQIFVAALLKPPAPEARLRKRAQRYKRRTTE